MHELWLQGTGKTVWHDHFAQGVMGRQELPVLLRRRPHFVVIVSCTTVLKKKKNVPIEGCMGMRHFHKLQVFCIMSTYDTMHSSALWRFARIIPLATQSEITARTQIDP